MKLSGKVAIITGTSPNIGGAIAEGLADEGARVACVDVVEDNARQCAEWIRTRGGDALGIVADTTDEAQVEAASRGRLLDFARMIPAGRLPSPRHYARAAVFLASDDAEMITGSDLRVDAG